MYKICQLLGLTPQCNVIVDVVERSHGGGVLSTNDHTCCKHWSHFRPFGLSMPSHAHFLGQFWYINESFFSKFLTYLYANFASLEPNLWVN
jgi:hypothetical protein